MRLTKWRPGGGSPGLWGLHTGVWPMNEGARSQGGKWRARCGGQAEARGLAEFPLPCPCRASTARGSQDLASWRCSPPGLLTSLVAPQEQVSLPRAGVPWSKPLLFLCLSPFPWTPSS